MGQIGEHLTHTQASQPCEYRVAKFPVCFPSVPGGLRVHRRGQVWTIGLRRDIRASPELLRCESSGCHTGRVSRVYGNFSYTRGTLAVWPRVLPCVTVWSGVS